MTAKSSSKAYKADNGDGFATADQQPKVLHGFSKSALHPSGEILPQETVCGSKKCIRGVCYHQDNVTKYHIGNPSIVPLPDFGPLAPIHLMEADTLARQHAKILMPHAFSDARSAPSTPYAPGVNSFKSTDTPMPALKAVATDSKITMDYNGPVFLMLQEGRIPQIQDSHCQISMDKPCHKPLMFAGSTCR